MKILLEGHPSLKTICRPWDFATDGDVDVLARRMVQTAYDAHGIGLAANQVGLGTRVFVIFLKVGWLTCVNPEIIPTAAPQAMELERCLSFPGLALKVRRPTSIHAVWHDAAGERREDTLHGLHARCFSHELDHLNGKTFVDGRPVARAMAEKKARGRR